MFFRRFQRKLTFRNSGTTLKRQQKPSKSTVLIFFLYRNQYRARRSQPQDAFVCKGCLCCAQPFQHNIGRGIKIANSDSMEVFCIKFSVAQCIECNWRHSSYLPVQQRRETQVSKASHLYTQQKPESWSIESKTDNDYKNPFSRYLASIQRNHKQSPKLMASRSGVGCNSLNTEISFEKTCLTFSTIKTLVICQKKRSIRHTTDKKQLIL